MSVIIKKIIFIVFISSSFLTFSQVQKKREFVTIYINNLNDKALESYFISKDTTSAHFSIYIKEFESKKEREKALKEYHDGLENSNGEPTFIITFYSSLADPILKPEKLKSLQGVKYITLKEFRDKNYPQSSPTYIIHKLKNGTYLKWKTNTLEIL